MNIDVILVTETGIPLARVSEYCVENRYNLIAVEFNKKEDGSSVPVFDLQDGVKLTLFRSSKYNTISAAVCNALSHCHGYWVFLINDATFHEIEHLQTIQKIAETVPRLASIHACKIPGIHPTQNNPFMGTLYATRVLKEIRTFEGTVPDISMVAFDWARAVREQGWANLTTYVSKYIDLHPSVSIPKLESDFEEEKNCDRLIIPQPNLPDLRDWMGVFKKRPWHYKATVVIPHYGKDLRLLTNIIESWRLQTEPPYMMVYDTGTPCYHHASLRALASYDTEVHFCRWHGVRNFYDTMAMAYNHGMTDCRTKHLIFTHNDVVPVSQTLVSELISSCNEEIPVVGYESSSVHGLIGTQLTAVYMPMMRKVRASWDIVIGYHWVEEIFNRCLTQAGVQIRFIGQEKRGLSKNSHFEHVGGSVTTGLYFSSRESVQQVFDNMEQVLKETEERLQVWRGA